MYGDIARVCSAPRSSALRTAKLIAKKVKCDKAITPNQYIYEAHVNTLQEIVEYIYDNNNTVFLVGHNPGVSTLAYMLCNLKESILGGWIS